MLETPRFSQMFPASFRGGGDAACMKLVFSSISFCNDLLLEIGFGLHVQSQGKCGLVLPLLHIASFLDHND